MSTTPGIRRYEVLAFITQYLAEHGGHSPSMREIATGCGLRAQTGVLAHVRQLAQDGYLLYEPVEPTSHAMTRTRKPAPKAMLSTTSVGGAT